jgi:hypothetical protein
VAIQRLWDGGRWVVGRVRWVTPVVLWEVAGGVDRAACVSTQRILGMRTGRKNSDVAVV